ncbi:retrovirus-related pol polyprotein from transposon TNT 1-94 [Tanacetum coccineum]
MKLCRVKCYGIYNWPIRATCGFFGDSYGDNLNNSRMSNVNAICAECGKCVFNSNHDACVSRYLNDVNARTKKPKGNDLLTGNRGSDLYTISLQETTSSTPICFMAKASPTQAWLWHRRLSHLNFNYITLLSKKDIVTGLPKLKYVKDQLCSSCEMSKAKRSSFKSKVVPSSKGRLNLLQHGTCVVQCGLRLNGKKYILATKFLNKTLHAYFKEEGIEHQTSTPRKPEQNGVVKRRNRTLVEAARAMLSASKLPLSFWAEAVRTMTVVGARETVGSQVVQQTGIQCFNCKGYGHYAKECRKPKRVKDYAYHKDKMMMCKQAEQGVPLQAEQADWLEDTDEKIDEQELEDITATWQKIQEVPPKEIQVLSGQAIWKGLLARKDIDIKEGLKTKAYEISVVNQKHDELVKKSLLTKSQLEGYLKENKKVISDLKVKEDKDIDKMIEMDKQLKFLNEIVYTRNQSIQTIHMLAPKCSTYNGRPTFANPRYLKKAQSEKPCLYEIPFDTSDPANRFAPDREETMTLDNESRSKLNKDYVKPYDYTKQNSLYEIFKAPSLEYLYQLERGKEYVKSLKKEVDELESEKANFSNMYDLLLEECVSKDVTCSYLHSLSDLNAYAELQCLYLHKVKECECLAQKLSKQTESVNNENLPQNRKQAEIHSNVLKPGMYRIATTTTQNREPQLPHASRNTNPHVSKSSGVNHTTSVSRPQLKCYQVKDKVVPNNSQVKFKKKEVEDHHRISSISKKTKSVTACNDSSNSRTSNVNAVCAKCGKCVFNSNHDACVSQYLHDMNARTKKPNVVPISASKPKRKVNKSVATPHKKTVASDTTIQKSKSYHKELYENTKSGMEMIVQLILFIVDSGCTKHMTGNLKLLCNFVEKFLGTVRFGNDQFAPILGYGDLNQGNVTIKRVYYIEGLNHNLFSVGQFCDADLEVAFRKSTCFVRDLQGNDLLTDGDQEIFHYNKFRGKSEPCSSNKMTLATDPEMCMLALPRVQGRVHADALILGKALPEEYSRAEYVAFLQVVLRLGINPMIQPEPEDLPKDNPKLEIAVLSIVWKGMRLPFMCRNWREWLNGSNLGTRNNHQESVNDRERLEAAKFRQLLAGRSGKLLN